MSTGEHQFIKALLFLSLGGHFIPAGLFADLNLAGAADGTITISNVGELATSDDAPEEMASTRWQKLREAQTFYWSLLKTQQKKYWGEVRDSYGLRFFVKDRMDPKAEAAKLYERLSAELPADQLDEIFEKDRPNKQKAAGLFTEYRPPEKFKWHDYFRYLDVLQNTVRTATKQFKAFDYTPYSLSPRTFVNDNVLRAPYLLAGRLQCTKSLALFSDVALGWFAYDQIHKAVDSYYKVKLTDSIIAQIEADAPKWNKLIDRDWMYRDLFEKVESGEMTPKVARQNAYLRSFDVEFYYNNFAATAEKTPEMESHLLELPNFAHIKFWKDNGIPESAGYVPLPGFQAKPSPKQLSALVDANRGRLDGYQMLKQIYLGNNALEKMDPAELKKVRDLTPEQLKEASPAVLQIRSLDDYRRNLEKQPYVRALRWYRANRYLTNEEFESRMEEDLNWTVRAQENQILLNVPYTLDEKGNRVPMDPKAFLKMKRKLHSDEIQLNVPGQG